MARRSGAYKSEKRKKELLRQKSQEEKRKKRFQRGAEKESEPGLTVQESGEQEGQDETPAEGEDTASAGDDNG